LNDLLTNWMMLPTLASSGPAAFAAMEEARDRGAPFDIILLDVQMPGMDGFAVAERVRDEGAANAPPIVMLSSAGNSVDTQRCRQIGVAAYICKPVRQADLFQTMVTVLGGRGPVHEASLSGPSEPDMAAPPARPLVILLAEDNVVNQRVARGILEKRGHTVVTVENGREATAAIAAQRFDVVLMDIQMPEMDGFEATAAIRQSETANGAHTPIIAMTAHAMKGDAERCLQAGMDDYLSKPIQPRDLLDAVARCLKVVGNESQDTRAMASGEGSGVHDDRAVADSTTSPQVASSESTEVFDLASLQARVENDWDLLMEMIELYLDSAPKLMSEIDAALARGDVSTVERLAHALKGALQNIGAASAARAAAIVEECGRAGDADAIIEALAHLKTELARLLRALPQTTVGTT
jgi:CheY-like chemotaxis protein